jgi:hypothetical protein
MPVNLSTVLLDGNDLEMALLQMMRTAPPPPLLLLFAPLPPP